MSELINMHEARQRAARRRAAGIAVDFDADRLSLARRLAGLPRTKLGKSVGVTPSAITQYEKGQAKPTLPILDGLAEALNVSTEFFRAGHPVPLLPAASAHFRSLRSTTAMERERALSFGELVLAVFAAVELHVELPRPQLPELDVPAELGAAEIQQLARDTREKLDIPTGPIPHVVRLLEAQGIAVARLEEISQRVDAFSHQHGGRPLVLLNPAKGDKARGRFDAAHELAHLVMHHDVDPGSQLVERQASMFAAEFLAPAAEIAADLSPHIDWTVLHRLKRRWGISLKALVVRAHQIGHFNDSTYQRALRQLNAWGLPERGELGPPEAPVLLQRAVAVLGVPEDVLPLLAEGAGLPLAEVERIWAAAGGEESRPAVHLAP